MTRTTSHHMADDDAPYLVLVHAVSRPPARAGLRLRSERDLAELMGVSRRRVRSVIDALVARDVLVRKHGSGTYLRRVLSPAAVPRPSNGKSVEYQPTDIFQLEETASGGDSVVSTKPLRLGIWWRRLQDLSDAMLEICDAAEARAQEFGHTFALHTIEFQPGETGPSLVDRIAEANEDGFIVDAWHQAAFRGALRRTSPPVVLVASGSSPIVAEPQVWLETDDVLIRGMKLLSQQGYERVGIVAYGARGEDASEVVALEYVSRRLVQYNNLEFARMGLCPTFEASREVTADILSGPDAADAIIVADDHLIDGVVKAFDDLGLVPGVDVGAVSMRHRGQVLAGDFDWTCVEFDLELFGQMLVDTLVRLVQTAGARASSVSVHGNLMVGKTHLRNGHDAVSDADPAPVVRAGA